MTPKNFLSSNEFQSLVKSNKKEASIFTFDNWEQVKISKPSELQRQLSKASQSPIFLYSRSPTYINKLGSKSHFKHQKSAESKTKRQLPTTNMSEVDRQLTTFEIFIDLIIKVDFFSVT